MKKIYLICMIFSLILYYPVKAQFAPAAGEPGSTAIYKDSAVIQGWAASCEVARGYINIADTTVTYTQGSTTSNKAFFGHDSLAIGSPGGTMDVVSLGDGGYAVLQFDNPITNGAGADFAVFENGYQVPSPPYLYFLELGFVEVSSDGINYVRFPAYSHTQDTAQVGGFDQLDPEDIHNLAGKYTADYGTPFDLEDLKDSTGVDINSITHVKIIDVNGNITDSLASYDSEGNKINDPWPTPYHSCGFDLDAVGVIHFAGKQSIYTINNKQEAIQVFPNPVTPEKPLSLHNNGTPVHYLSVSMLDFSGKTVCRHEPESGGQTPWRLPRNIKPGIYVLQVITGESVNTVKIVVSR